MAGLLSLSGLTGEQTTTLLHAKGYFTSEAAVIAAYPSGVSGDWAIAGPSGFTSMYVWDDGAATWVASHGQLNFGLVANTPVVLSQVADSASIIAGLSFEEPSPGFTLEAALGGVRNSSGRTIHVVRGLISLHLVSANASSKQVFLYSERSSDNGVTWTVNPNSGREGTVAGQEERYDSKSSEGFDWLDGEIVRFRIYTDGASLSIAPVAFTVNAEVIDGPSARWNMQEV